MCCTPSTPWFGRLAVGRTPCCPRRPTAPCLKGQKDIFEWHGEGFDISVLEIFWPLCFGFRLFLSSMLTARQGPRLAQLLEAQGASLLQGTPALWRSLISAGWRGHPGGARQRLVSPAARLDGHLWRRSLPSQPRGAFGGLESALERLRPHSHPLRRLGCEPHGGLGSYHLGYHPSRAGCRRCSHRPATAQRAPGNLGR